MDEDIELDNFNVIIMDKVINLDAYIEIDI